MNNIVIHNNTPDPNYFPLAWASDWGEDNYGLWMAFTFKKIRYALRWIKPGRFMMGSPEDEPQRYDDELQHEVILTQGFWMGETACTQELWEAVMGVNPSKFKGAKRPVENVSWNDCMAFIKKLNDRLPGLDLHLPTEVEWEYACRAGTQTPFSFGDNITTDQVNYDGDYPYDGAPKGKNRGKTVEVGTLPCNSWGLYEMHGNVYEWCSDWYGEYPSESVVDPMGPESGEDRVLRGGGWFYFGRNVRSALRYLDEPDFRGDGTGLRFARGHQEGQGLAEPKE
ncbi:formylglycine-generating enzyme family protein [Desulfococcaceae bacterium HSG9]|nr:formylglycine-generating enzyme family protein [Desulfococcaceae bacterium HSG9]